jgi:nicotinamide phosphoribosyltransferase
MQLNRNPLLCCDSYKISHFNQYPEGIEHVYSYIAPRGGEHPLPILGIHDFCDMLSVTNLNQWFVSELEDIAQEHGMPFNPEWWDLLVKYEGKGFPLRVMGVPEGTVVDPKTPVAVIINTDPEFPWLTSFFETLFLRMVWYPSTIAAECRYMKGRIKEFMIKTGADLANLPFKLHDFAPRGCTSGEQAQRGGTGHLTQFQGTDNLEAIKFIRDNYGLSMAGFSIPATEHSTVTSWGREHEKAMYEAFVRKNLGEGKMGACVSDSYDIDEAIDMWKELEPVILEVGGTLVIRPDSGDPVAMPLHVLKRCLDVFGYTTNDEGYKVLPSHIRVIQGDGIDKHLLVRIMQCMVDAKISIDNIAFGMGGGLLQKVDRDTYKWAMKCSAARINGEWRDVYKDPKGGNKKSLKGLVIPDGVVAYEDASMIINSTAGSCPRGFMEYYRDGVHASRDSFDIVRQRASI